MLASILHISVAAEVSISIMRAFVAMRKIISSNLIEQRYINDLVLKDSKRIDLLEATFSKIERKEKSYHIFFDGQVYDAYSLLVDILEKAKESIIIIDNYIDKKILDMVAKTKKEVTFVTKDLDKIAIEKCKKQYTNIKIVVKNTIRSLSLWCFF